MLMHTGDMFTHGLLVTIVVILIIGYLIRHLVTIVLAGIALSVLLVMMGFGGLHTFIPSTSELDAHVSSFIQQFEDSFGAESQS